MSEQPSQHGCVEQLPESYVRIYKPVCQNTDSFISVGGRLEKADIPFDFHIISFSQLCRFTDAQIGAHTSETSLNSGL